MLEMVETAYILNHATSDSLIVMDEVGRGTSTYDGISIAWAIVEHFVSSKNLSAKTLFATHYHELTELEDHHPKKIKNYSLAVDDKKGKPVFLYTLVPHSAPTSFGVEVAELAGLPSEVLKGAYQKLTELEEEHHGENSVSQTYLNQLDELDLDNMTPKAALETLYKLKEKHKT